MSLNRFVLAAGVLAVGFVGALPFRHPKLQPAAVTAPSWPSDLPLRRQDVTLQVSPLTDTSPAVGLEQLSLKSRPPTSLAPPDAESVAPALEDLGSPPSFSPMYESLLVGAGGTSELADSPYAAAQQIFGQQTSAQSVGFSSGARDGLPREDYRPALREHRIVDGDTLSGLAQRYLGDAARAEEVYELNRDRLRDPNVLPVGKRLRIPQRGEALLTPVARLGP